MPEQTGETRIHLVSLLMAICMLAIDAELLFRSVGASGDPMGAGLPAIAFSCLYLWVLRGLVWGVTPGAGGVRLLTALGPRRITDDELRQAAFGAWTASRAGGTRTLRPAGSAPADGEAPPLDRRLVCGPRYLALPEMPAVWFWIPRRIINGVYLFSYGWPIVEVLCEHAGIALAPQEDADDAPRVSRVTPVLHRAVTVVVLVASLGFLGAFLFQVAHLRWGAAPLSSVERVLTFVGVSGVILLWAALLVETLRDWTRRS